MFDLKCYKCGGSIIIDYDKTIEFYTNRAIENKSISYINKLWSYYGVWFICNKCNNSLQLTIEDVSKLMYDSIYKDILSFKKNIMFKKINPNTIDPDNGLSYCGVCDGIDGEGNCYKDIIKQCELIQ